MNKYAVLASYAQHMVDTSRDVAPFTSQEIVELLAEREADKARIAELESYRAAYLEWHDKTEWVQQDKRFDVLIPWGKHRADVLKEYIHHLESRKVKLPAGTEVNGFQMLIESEVMARLSEAGITATPFLADGITLETGEQQ